MADFPSIFLDSQGQYGELENVLASAAHDDPAAATDKMRAYLVRLLFRRLLARLRAGFVWIDLLRAVREKRDKAYDLLKRNVHRKQAVKKWAALVLAEGQRVAAAEREGAAAAKLTRWLFSRLVATSGSFQCRYPGGWLQRKSNPAAAAPARSHPESGAAALAAIVAAAAAAEAQHAAELERARLALDAELEVQAAAFLKHAAVLKGASADQMAKLREEVLIAVLSG